MSLLRHIMKAWRAERVRAHKRWLRKNRVFFLPGPPVADSRDWLGQFKESHKP